MVWHWIPRTAHPLFISGSRGQTVIWWSKISLLIRLILIGNLHFRKISALNQAEVARENYRLLDFMLGKERRQGKEGGDLLDPVEVSHQDPFTSNNESILGSPQASPPNLCKKKKKLPYPISKHFLKLDCLLFEMYLRDHSKNSGSHKRSFLYFFAPLWSYWVQHYVDRNGCFREERTKWIWDKRSSRDRIMSDRSVNNLEAHIARPITNVGCGGPWGCRGP